ncbi:aminotransferase class V-fold PLP-dependent enzyme [Marinomonas epiphytica]
MISLDSQYVKSQFPAFSEPSLAGQAPFECAGGSYVCRQVLDTLNRYYHQNKVQPYHLHPAALKAGELMDHAHERIADYLNIPNESVYLGPSTSQNLYVLANAVAKKLAPGDEIIVTNQDHEANIGVWRSLSRFGIKLVEWSVDENGSLNINKLPELITHRTKLIAFTHCSNIVAEVNPVKEICAIAKAAGVVSVVDGVSYAAHGLPDITGLGADVYLFSLYKTYGPHLGVMTVQNEVAQWLGNQGHYFNEHLRQKWFVPAGPDHAQVAAAVGVIDYLDDLYQHHFSETLAPAERAEKVRGLLHEAEQPLLARLLDFITCQSELTLLGPAQASRRAATVSFVHQSMTPQDFVQRLTEHGIICGAGNFYSVRLLKAMGVNPETGVVRLSFTHYASHEDIEQVISALQAVLVQG